jgi:Iap family predicted aminopeptidase
VAATLAAVIATGCGGSDSGSSSGTSATRVSVDRFDSRRAFALIKDQVALGQRPAGSAPSRELAEKLRRMLPNGRFDDVPHGLRNVVGALPGRRPAIVVGAHYDTEYHPKGFVGANDGAAGTAAVVELARVLKRELPADHPEIRFVLFDGEEDPPGCTDAHFEQCALRGSRAYVEQHVDEIGQMILLDYVANRGLQIPREANSDRALWERLRAAAAAVGAESYFPPEGKGPRYAVIDDHIPFLREGIPSIDLIDFSYQYADTVQDTPDKLDPAALDAVGETVAELLTRIAARPHP